MPLLSASPEVRQVPRLRLVKEDETPYDTVPGWRPMMPPELGPLGPDAIAVYFALCLYVDRRTGECWPSQGTIAERVGMRREAVNRALKRLGDAGFVVVTHQEDRGMKRSNMYLLPHQKTANVQMCAEDTTMCAESTADVLSAHSRCAPTAHKPYPVEPEIKEPKGDTPLTPQSRAEYPAEFEAFWTQYPSGHGNKKKTAEAWKKLKPGPDDVAAIMAGLARWNACDRWRRGYVKDALVWLRDRWWQDEPPPPDPAPSPNGRNGKAEAPVDYFIRRAGGVS